MTKLVRTTTIMLFFGLLTVAAPSQAQTSADIGERLAKTYGLNEFGQIETIRYTFNGQFPGVNVSRTWVWQPKTGEIFYESKDKDGKVVKVSYLQSQLSSAPANIRDQIDPAFVNDKYNLIFPLQAYWDGAPFRDMGQQKLPIGEGSARKVVVDYGPGGDLWGLYVGADYRVVAFNFHRGGPRKPSVVIATWDGYKKAGPLLISTDRRGTADGQPLRIFFTDVAVKLAGSDNWVNAQ